MLSLKLNVNQKAHTIEEMLRKRQRLVVSIADSLFRETRCV